ncbi:MAG: hypothetical protein IT462_04225 [Planctomycetes bacterium]|nr:hypothetical protein [Planctomycetota bacterium]
MRIMLALAAVALLALSGCKDHGADIRALQDDLASTRGALEDARADAERQQGYAAQRLKALEDKLDALERGYSGADIAALRKDVVELRATGKPVEAGLEKRLAEVETRVERIKEETATKAEMKPAAVDEKTISAIVDKKLAEQQESATPTKNFADAMERLNISNAEKAAIRDEVKKTKKDMLELLEIPMHNGRVPAEEVIDTLIRIGAKEQGADERFGKLLLELSSEKVPGDPQGRSYVKAVEDLKKQNREAISRVLSPADQRKLDAAHKDWSEFEIGDDDPWGAIYLERLDKYNKEKK